MFSQSSVISDVRAQREGVKIIPTIEFLTGKETSTLSVIPHSQPPSVLHLVGQSGMRVLGSPTNI